MNKEELKIGILGLGYVGLPLAVEFAKKFDVLGFDISKKRVKELENNIDITNEVSTEDLEKRDTLDFSFAEKDLSNVNFFIVTVPTPIDSSNTPNLEPLKVASKTVGRYLKKGDIVVFESTVYPGCTEEMCIPLLEKVSGLILNKDFFCGYSPERVNPGDKIYGLANIKKITSGSTDQSAKFIDDIYSEIIKAGTFKARTIKIAEAAKVIENSQRDLNIAFVNELSLIFSLMGLDTIEVLEAAESKWNFLPFRPGMVGGHCIGVDPYYLTHKAEMLGYQPEVILAGRRINNNMSSMIATKMINLISSTGINLKGSRIGLMGVTFKENCPDIRNSKIFDLIHHLKTWDIDILVADPLADKEEVKELHDINIVSLKEFKDLDSLIVSVGHTEYRNLNVQELRGFCKTEIKPVLADLKGIYSKNEAEKGGFFVYRL
tara:strand:+ start:61 stop:1359 length:1299 start_codon:yes stop_codon:yes gene_type:complete